MSVLRPLGGLLADIPLAAHGAYVAFLGRLQRDGQIIDDALAQMVGEGRHAQGAGDVGAPRASPLPASEAGDEDEEGEAGEDPHGDEDGARDMQRGANGASWA